MLAHLVRHLKFQFPHYPDNSASDAAFIEFWKDAKSNFDWWGGDVTAPKSDRVKQAMKQFFAFMESPGIAILRISSASGLNQIILYRPVFLARKDYCSRSSRKTRGIDPFIWGCT